MLECQAIPRGKSCSPGTRLAYLAEAQASLLSCQESSLGYEVNLPACLRPSYLLLSLFKMSFHLWVFDFKAPSAVRGHREVGLVLTLQSFLRAPSRSRLVVSFAPPLSG